jgi:hypothetical protein
MIFNEKVDGATLFSVLTQTALSSFLKFFRPFSGHGLPDLQPPKSHFPCCRLLVSYMEQMYGIPLNSIHLSHSQGSFITFDDISKRRSFVSVSYYLPTVQFVHHKHTNMHPLDTSQGPRSLRLESAAARMLGLQVRILLGAWVSVSCECCVL